MTCVIWNKPATGVLTHFEIYGEEPHTLAGSSAWAHRPAILAYQSSQRSRQIARWPETLVLASWREYGKCSSDVSMDPWRFAS